MQYIDIEPRFHRGFFRPAKTDFEMNAGKNLIPLRRKQEYKKTLLLKQKLKNQNFLSIFQVCFGNLNISTC